MKRLHENPLVNLLAIVSALAGLFMIGVSYRWHHNEERANALQERWLQMDQEWNAEIIERLRRLEADECRGDPQ